MNPFDSLRDPGAVGQNIQNAFTQGMKEREAREQKNALAQYATNPDAPGAYEALAQSNPEVAMQERARRQQQALAGVEAHKESILAGAKIFRQLGVKDEASYQQALGLARQYGIPLDGVPQNYDPQYVEGITHLADAFDPQKADQGRYIPLQPGGSVAHIGPDGRAEMVIMGNDGSHPIGAPATDMPTVATPEDAMRLPPGTQFRMPDGRIGTVPGGAGGNASGSFLR